jgi:hypothetical protein
MRFAGDETVGFALPVNRPAQKERRPIASRRQLRRREIEVMQRRLQVAEEGLEPRHAEMIPRSIPENAMDWGIRPEAPRLTQQLAPKTTATPAMRPPARHGTSPRRRRSTTPIWPKWTAGGARCSRQLAVHPASLRPGHVPSTYVDRVRGVCLFFFTWRETALANWKSS